MNLTPLEEKIKAIHALLEVVTDYEDLSELRSRAWEFETLLLALKKANENEKV